MGRVRKYKINKAVIEPYAQPRCLLFLFFFSAHGLTGIHFSNVTQNSADIPVHISPTTKASGSITSYQTPIFYIIYWMTVEII